MKSDILTIVRLMVSHSASTRSVVVVVVGWIFRIGFVCWWGYLAPYGIRLLAAHLRWPLASDIERADNEPFYSTYLDFQKYRLSLAKRGFRNALALEQKTNLTLLYSTTRPLSRPWTENGKYTLGFFWYITILRQIVHMDTRGKIGMLWTILDIMNNNEQYTLGFFWYIWITQ